MQVVMLLCQPLGGHRRDGRDGREQCTLYPVLLTHQDFRQYIELEAILSEDNLSSPLIAFQMPGSVIKVCIQQKGQGL